MIGLISGLPSPREEEKKNKEKKKKEKIASDQQQEGKLGAGMEEYNQLPVQSPPCRLTRATIT